MDSISYILLFLITVTLFLSFFNRYPDISPYLLEYQSSFSHFRNSGESAIYKNRIIPSDLFFLKEKIFYFETTYYKILRDILQEGLNKKSKSKIYSVFGKEIHEFSYDDLKKKILSFQSYIFNFCSNIKKLAVFLPNTLENFIASIAAHFSGLTLVVIPVLENIDFSFFMEIICTVKPDLLIISDNIFSLNDLKKIRMISEIILVTKQSNYLTLENIDPTIKIWDNICNSENLYFEKIFNTVQDTLIMFVNIEKNRKFTISEFSHLNFISAYIGLKNDILEKCEFTDKDIFQSTIPYLDNFSRIVLYSTFVAGSSIIFKSEFLNISDSICHNLFPTILLVPSETILYLANKIDSYLNSSIFSFWYKWSISSLNNGRISKGIPFIYKSLGITNKLKLLLTSYTFENFTDLDISQIRTIQAGLGTKITRSLCCNRIFGPISSTNPNDYRHKVHFGPPSSTLEVKIVNLNSENEFELTSGHIFARGLSVTFKDTDNWVYTGLNGIFGEDGCLIVK
ncbi:uncharacterized protein T551_00466 [Pneumocystis jirovecii RU7]|uniref:AMP-dependent synthetase/ligase domain-containing protein n=1 Tax=Pneumocystis jirovecii (strain RU7) TaxID=1408657 RepID=A0A0W4ZVJ6_PNEJ7|nr:uncharacterized protein T551_00466 [Pneumocystis jirovecii RU7]KTW32376.1 hypothetical protein T551_00466 [Pneumocystis jirovecii RU7]